MKHRLLFFAFLLLFSMRLAAQLPNGSIAPDWTMTSITGGGPYNLYTLLNQGKVVFIDFSATWCGPCWNYHNTHALKTLYETHGPAPGDDKARVFFIEGDPSTNTNCLYGPSGCNSSTQGNWVTGTPYPIIDDNSNLVTPSYSINYFPTIYGICPVEKTIYEVGQQSATGLWNWAQNTCSPFALLYNVNVTHVACRNGATGKIILNPTTGQPPYTYHWNTNANTKDLLNIAAGTYTCTITASNGLSAVTTPIQVNQPAAALSSTGGNLQLVGCNGVYGAVTVFPAGGTPDYSYHWNNNSIDQTLTGASAGTYRCTVTDNNGCTNLFTQVFAPAVYPTASIATPPILTCTQPTAQLNATASSTGPQFSYSWVAGNNGTIVSGGTTLTPTVGSPATYILTVLNTESTCQSTASKVVTGNQAPPTANAGPPGAITCSQTSLVLAGNGTTGNGTTYLWTASNGGNIVSGSTTLTPTVNAAGTYRLVVTSPSNGCTAASTTTVSANNQPPSLSTTGGMLTCINPTVGLTATTNGSANTTFSWTGPNGFISLLQNPTVAAGGAYVLQINDPATGCTNTSTATVELNNSSPTISATSGMLTCANPTTTLAASSSASNSTFLWTGPNGFSNPNQNATASFSGTYDLLVTAPNGCTSAASTVVSQNTTVPTAAAGTDATLNCNAAQAQLSGANSSQGNNFNYLWTTTTGHIVSGATTLTPTIDASGTYILQVLNVENGCSATDEAFVVQNLPPAAVISASQNVACFGGNNGSATVAASQGNGSFSFAWSNGSTNPTIQNLTAGTYSVVVTDGENCSASTSIFIAEPLYLAANATATAQQQNGQNDGAATANPTGGNGNFTFLWSNGANSPSISSLAPGSYSVVVTDSNGCSATETVTVNAVGCAISASMNSQNVVCFGETNGSATAILNGATAPISYLWSNGATTSTAFNLAAGQYSVQILDASGCPASLSVDILQPQALSANATATAETAQNAQNGTASANPTGGTAPFQFLWSNGATTASISGLAPAVYSVAVTDAHGCVSTQNVVVGSFACALQPSISTVQVACFGGNNGQATVSLGGGIAPFQYLWSNGATTATASNLTAGSYEIIVTDASHCQTTETVVMTQPTQLSVSETHQNVLCPTENAGEIVATASGGVPNYNFLWSNGATTPTVSGLVAGNYTAIVTDANGCSTSLAATISSTDLLTPTLVLKNISVEIDENGVAQINAAAFDDGSTDNCGIVAWSVSQPTFDCSQLGEKTVVVTAIDGSGNAISGLAKVTVLDKKPPVLTCPNSKTTSFCKATVSYDYPIATDNCVQLGGQWAQLAGLPSGSVFPLGATTNTFSYTDLSGNMGVCSFEIVVLEAPTVAVTATDQVHCHGGFDGVLQATTTGGNAPFDIVWSNGQTGPLAVYLPAGEYVAVVTDAAGCTTTSPIGLITEPSAIQIGLDQLSNDVNNAGIGSISLTIGGGTPNYTFNWTKNGQPFAATTADLTGLFAGEYQVVVIDQNGCAIQSQKFVVENTVAAFEPTWAKGMALQPNPTSGLVQLIFKNELVNSLAINVLDANGRVVRTFEMSENQSTFDLDLSELAGGVYWLSLRSERDVTGRRLVIAR